MRLAATSLAACTVFVLGMIPGIASAQSKPKVRLVEVAPVDASTAMAVRPGDDTVYVAEQEGRVVAVAPDGTIRRRPVLDIRSRVTAEGEQGLLGLAFSPAGDRLYVHFTNVDGNTRVEEYPVVADDDVVTARPNGRRQLLAIRDREDNHNGGQLAFGPDGELYLGMGDGGGGGDEGDGHAKGGNGQSQETPLGKILILDVDDGGASICDLGLRNPWRFSFDRATGDLWIGDVGQDAWEEIDMLPADEPCGHNLGWNVFEGRERYRSGRVDDHVEPVAVLSQDDGNCSVIGGYVYRGEDIPELEGWYVYTDYCNGELRALRVRGNGSVAQTRLGADVESPTSFGEDEAGELYVLSQADGLFRLAAR